MKAWLTIAFFSLVSFTVLAQAPLGFNYQGIAREADGTPISDTEIGIRISITDGPQEAIMFTEDHFLTTNQFGLFTAVVGRGNGNNTLNSVDWSVGNLWLQIELDPDNSGSYLMMGSQQLMSVPYALFAQQSGESLNAGYGIDINNGAISNLLPDRPITITGAANVQVSGTYPNFTIESSGSADADADPANEIQSITKSGMEVSLSDGGGSFIDDVNDADADATNEIQDLQLVGNNLSITLNGTPTIIDLSPYLDDTDTQLTEAEVDAFVANDNYLKTEVDGSVSNELQTISKAGSTVTLSNSGGSFTDAVDDADADATNELQDLQLVGNNLSITLNGTPTVIDLSPYLDNTDSQDLSSVLTNGTSAGNNKITNLADPTLAQDAVTKSYLETESAKDFAISVPISFTSSGVAGDVTMDLSGAVLDKGGLISGSTITITEAGVYSISVQGFSGTAVGSDIDIEVSGIPTSVLKGLSNYVGMYLFDLAVSDTISIIIKFGTSVETVNLQVSVYKI